MHSSPKTLMTLPCIGEKKAIKIFQEVERNGRFVTTPDAKSRTKGIFGPKTWEILYEKSYGPLITVNKKK